MYRFFLPALIGISLLTACSSAKKSQVSKAPAPKPVPAATAPANAPAGALPTATDGIAWILSDELMPILEQAQKVNKPVFLEFYATWCGPCKVMEKEVFHQPEVTEYLNKNFLNYRVNVDKPNGRKLTDIYEVEGMPTVIFVDPKGVVLERELGLITQKRFQGIADKALAKMK